MVKVWQESWFLAWSYSQESRTSAKPTSQSKTGRDSRGIGANTEVPELCWSVVCLTSQYGNYCQLLTLHVYTCLSACQSCAPMGLQIHFCSICAALAILRIFYFLWLRKWMYAALNCLFFFFFSKTRSTLLKNIERIVFVLNWGLHGKCMHFLEKKISHEFSTDHSFRAAHLCW